MEEENKKQDELAQSIKAGHKMNLVGAIIVAAVIIGASFFLSRGIAAPGPSEGSSNLDLVSSVSEKDFVRGDRNAPITLIEYADFSCHFCSLYHPTLQRLVAEYGGRVRWVYRNLPIFNIEASVSGQCVGKLAGEETFWQFADTLYANQDKYSTGYYKDVATDLGVDGDAYDACISDPTVKNSIQTDFNRVRILLGFNSTPYNVLVDKDGRTFPFSGALPYDDLKSVVDKLLE